MGDYSEKESYNDDFKIDDLKFLLKRLKEINSNHSLSKDEREILSLLIEQIYKLINEKQRTKIKNTIKASLEDKIDDYIIIFLKSNCKECMVRGILTNVYQDFIVLIDDIYLLQVKIDEIASVQTQITNNHHEHSEKIKFKDQYYLEEEYFEDNESNDTIINNKINDSNSGENNEPNNKMKITKEHKEYTEE